jgi:hypothetical protein
VGEVPQVALISTSIIYQAVLDPPAMASGSRTMFEATTSSHNRLFLFLALF